MTQFSLGSVSLVKTKSVSSRDVHRMVDLIVAGISQYAFTPLLRHAKTKSVSGKSNNFILLREKSSIVGFGMYRVERSICIIYEVHVDADYRSMGCGTVLIEQVIEDQKGKTVVLFVHKKNHQAQVFYRKFGFELEDSYEDRSYFKMSRNS